MGIPHKTEWTDIREIRGSGFTKCQFDDRFSLNYAAVLAGSLIDSARRNCPAELSIPTKLVSIPDTDSGQPGSA
jgi:hypothetical protein